MKTKTEQKIAEINLSALGILVVRAYRRLKQVEKHLADKIAGSKEKLLAMGGHRPFIGIENGKKVCSIAYQVKTGFDKEAFAKAYPEIDLARFEKTSDPFLVVRLH